MERTKALAITKAVKGAVAERDSVDGWPCCIWCGRPAPTDNRMAYSNAHYIARSQGGLGIERNILTLCSQHHMEYDTWRRAEMKPVLQKYLRGKYPDWKESELIYRK